MFTYLKILQWMRIWIMHTSSFWYCQGFYDQPIGFTTYTKAVRNKRHFGVISRKGITSVYFILLYLYRMKRIKYWLQMSGWTKNGLMSCWLGTPLISTESVGKNYPTIHWMDAYNDNLIWWHLPNYSLCFSFFQDSNPLW